MKKAVAECTLNAEMDQHLSRESDNHRHGHDRKRVSTESRSMDLAVPRDRRASFEPAQVEKYVRRRPGFDDKVLSMYACGMTTRENRGAHGGAVRAVSRELVSKVTDAVHEEVREWQSRPLESTYTIVYFDAVRVKIRDEGLVRNKAVHLAVGATSVDSDPAPGARRCWGCGWGARRTRKGRVLAVGDERAQGARRPGRADRGGRPKGLPEAIEGVFPDAVVQTRIVHLMRHSLAHAARKERRELAAAIRPIYQPPTAAAVLDDFEAGPSNEKYPAIARSRCRHVSL